MKERFTQEEWELLKILPFQVFIMVAAADGKVDKKEWAQQVENLRNAPFYKDELHRELFIDIASAEIDTPIKEAADVAKLTERTSRIKEILKQKLNPEEYQKFIASIFINGLQVAGASGGSFLGLGDKVSNEEKQALAMFAGMFELDIDKLAKSVGEK